MNQKQYLNDCLRFIQFISPVFYPEGSIHFKTMHFVCTCYITLFGYANQRLCTYLKSATRIPSILSLSSVMYRLYKWFYWSDTSWTQQIQAQR
jgi:hypothetical protein